MSMVHAMVPRLVDFIATARENGVAIVFVRTSHNAWTNGAAWLERMKDVSVNEIPICQEGSWDGEYYLVQPEPGDKIVVKHRYSGFYGTDLDVVLKARGIRTLLVTGVATNVCVESTARDGFQRDYYIVFMDDGSSTYDLADHQATLRNINNQFGVVATFAEVVEAWGKRRNG